MPISASGGKAWRQIMVINKFFINYLIFFSQEKIEFSITLRHRGKRIGTFDSDQHLKFHPFLFILFSKQGQSWTIGVAPFLEMSLKFIYIGKKIKDG